MLLFAGLAEAVGQREVQLDARPDVATLTADLRERWPDLAGHVFRVAVNQTYVDAAHPLVAGDEVALIPPVSGG